jgi:benzylsuccinate CoA-transferase BbsF subunit
LNTEIKPFTNLKVIDFTWAGVGPFTGNFLAYYGATTVRVESATRPDPVRNPMGFTKMKNPGLERGPVFAHTHPVEKLDLSLNMKNPKALEIFKKLVSWADVMVENFTTGAIERMGLGYDELKKIKPSLVLHRTNGYGHTGPMASQPGLGQTVTALTGMHGITGWPDRLPVPISSYYTDQLAPLFGALTLIAAVYHARATGEGQCIDHSQVEAGINYISPLILDYTVNGRELKINGNSSNYAAPYGAYACKGDERWIAIGVYDDKEWDGFCKVINNPDLSQDPRFSTLSARIKNKSELDALVNNWTANFTAEQVMDMMQSQGVSAGVVENAEDTEKDPQLTFYNYFHELDHPYLGKLNFYHPPGFTLSKAPAKVARPPLVGEYNKYICTELLDMPDDEFKELMQQGVFD